MVVKMYTKKRGGGGVKARYSSFGYLAVGPRYTIKHGIFHDDEMVWLTFSFEPFSHTSIARFVEEIEHNPSTGRKLFVHNPLRARSDFLYFIQYKKRNPVIQSQNGSW